MLPLIFPLFAGSKISWSFAVDSFRFSSFARLIIITVSHDARPVSDAASLAGQGTS
jgi:hypothetical protein